MNLEIDDGQKAVKCRGCGMMFVAHHNDMQAIFCGGENCPCFEKPRIDAEKLREYAVDGMWDLIKEHGDIFSAPKNIQGKYSIYLELSQKLDAGEFDVKGD